jgi:glyoxylase-like metal-dependent hydrolase (beta-lactamase superfamily II)
LAGHLWIEDRPIYSFVVEHPDGPLVIDTGLTASLSQNLPRGIALGWGFSTREDEEIGAQLRARGMDPADIRTVIPTHLHFDHAEAATQFRNAEIYVHRREYEQARKWPWRAISARWLATSAVEIYDLEPRALGPFPHSLALGDGGDVVVVPTPGHTRGSVSVAVRDGDRWLLFVGDHTPSQEVLAEECADGCTRYWYPHLRDAERSRDRIRSFTRSYSTVLIPTHDPGSPARIAARDVVRL